MKAWIIVILLGAGTWAAGLSAVLGGCQAVTPTQPVQERYSFQRMQMGVRSEVTLYAPSQAAARDAAALAFDEINRLEEIFSDYRPRSEVSRLCDLAREGPMTESVPVSEDLARILRASSEISRATGGDFDVTVGAATKLWRETRRAGKLPEASVLEAATATVGWESVQVDEEGKVRLNKRGTRIDFGAIAKGYAAQRAVEVLTRAGFPTCMVALAGDVAVGDPPPGEAGWIVAVLTGREGSGGGERSAPEEIRLRNAAVSTSGDASQWVEIEGRRFAHILDPKTGLGSARIRAATVIARDRGGLTGGMRADALSTALFLTEESPEAFARRFGVAVIVVDASVVRRFDPLGLIER